MIVFGLGKNLLFKSVLGHCAGAGFVGIFDKYEPLDEIEMQP